MPTRKLSEVIKRAVNVSYGFFLGPWRKALSRCRRPRWTPPVEEEFSSGVVIDSMVEGDGTKLGATL